MNLGFHNTRIRAGLTLLVALAMIPTSVAGAALVDFFDAAGSPEAILSEMAIHPASLRIGDVTYMAYQGVGYDPYVTSYNEVTGEWAGPVRAGINPLVLDTHGAPSLYVDASGRLNLIYGGHNRPLYHSRTVVPGDISRWESLSSIEEIATYPQTFPMADGRIALFYRTSNYNWYMRISDAAGAYFGPPETVLLGGSDTWWYADFRPGSGGTIHAAFVWNDYIQRIEGQPFARKNVYYMRRDPDGVWRTADDEVVPTPIDHATADTTVRVVDSGSALVNEISVKEDDTGAPCILFLTGTDAGPDGFGWRYMRRVGDGWSISPITTTDHFFDSGAILPGVGGAVEALLVAGDSGAEGAENGNYRGRGGRIERWLSSDYGVTWSRESTVTPEESATLFGDPQFVIGGSGDARAMFVEWDNDGTSFFHRVYLWGDSGRVERDLGTQTDRLAGNRRADTAIAISRESFPEGSNWVVVARQDDFPDALTGIPLAHALHAPLLLADRDTMSAATQEEIVRLGATKAIFLGGNAALGPKVESDTIAKTTVNAVERLAGQDRYETSREIAHRLRQIDVTAPQDTAFVVSGRNWPDATTAAPLAATARAPIVLVKETSIPGPSNEILEEWGVSRTVVVGGERVIGPEVLANLPLPLRVAGADRYLTAEAVARYGIETTLLPYRAMVATGRDFPDALTGAGLAARVRAPMLLTAQDGLSHGAEDYFASYGDRVIQTYIIGSDDVVGENVVDQVRGFTE